MCRVSETLVREIVVAGVRKDRERFQQLASPDGAQRTTLPLGPELHLHQEPTLLPGHDQGELHGLSYSN